MPEIQFQLIPWREITASVHPGEKGSATWKTQIYPTLRLRMVQYDAGYLADHWCQKGHIVHCLEGSFVTEMENGATYTLTAGMTYIVSDGLSSHRSSTATGVTLLIIDGDFFKE